MAATPTRPQPDVDLVDRAIGSHRSGEPGPLLPAARPNRESLWFDQEPIHACFSGEVEPETAREEVVKAIT